jgi:hypothetical protein
MSLVQEIKAFAGNIPADFKEKKGLCELTFVVAERKAFLSKEKLTYAAKFRVDDGNKLVKFTELLKETSFKTGKDGRSESVIEQQSTQFGQKYDYRFDFKSVREKIESLAQAAGYDFQYQVTARGL